MSGATLVNLLLDLRQFEYQEQAERDVEQALRELQGRLTDSSSTPVGSSQSNKGVLSIDEDAIQKVMGYVHRGIEKVSGEGEVSESLSTKETAVEKMVPCLFPPGCCIHFYRDGSGIDGTYVPCTFFDEVSKRLIIALLTVLSTLFYVILKHRLLLYFLQRLMLRGQWLMIT